MRKLFSPCSRSKYIGGEVKREMLKMKNLLALQLYVPSKLEYRNLFKKSFFSGMDNC